MPGSDDAAGFAYAFADTPHRLRLPAKDQQELFEQIISIVLEGIDQDSIIFEWPTDWLSYFDGLNARINDSPAKEDQSRLPIPDQEEKRMIHSEDLGFRRSPSTAHSNTRSSSRLGALLVHVDKGLVHDGGQKESLRIVRHP